MGRLDRFNESADDAMSEMAGCLRTGIFFFCLVVMLGCSSFGIGAALLASGPGWGAGQVITGVVIFMAGWLLLYRLAGVLGGTSERIIERIRYIVPLGYLALVLLASQIGRLIV